MELAARQRVEEQVVELMKDGYDKQRAEAELNFRKEKQRIEKEEQERLALYDKLKASGAKVSSADRTTITAQAAAQRVQAAQLLDNRLAEIDRKEEEENRKSSRNSSVSIRTTRRSVKPSNASITRRLSRCVVS